MKAVSPQLTTGGKRPTPQEPMEYRYTGEIFGEFFGNPNIGGAPFAAKVLIAWCHDRLCWRSEAELTRVLEDVHVYLEANS